MAQPTAGTEYTLLLFGTTLVLKVFTHSSFSSTGDSQKKKLVFQLRKSSGHHSFPSTLFFCLQLQAS